MKANPSAAQLKANICQGMAFLIAVALSLSITGCGSSGTSTSPRTLASLATTPANYSLVIGDSQQLTATGTYSDGSTLNLTSSVSWSSSDSSITTVSTSGLAHKRGARHGCYHGGDWQHQHPHEFDRESGAGFDCSVTSRSVHIGQWNAAVHGYRNL